MHCAGCGMPLASVYQACACEPLTPEEVAQARAAFARSLSKAAPEPLPEPPTWPVWLLFAAVVVAAAAVLAT
jgi:hypothetical protein